MGAMSLAMREILFSRCGPHRHQKNSGGQPACPHKRHCRCRRLCAAANWLVGSSCVSGQAWERDGSLPSTEAAGKKGGGFWWWENRSSARDRPIRKLLLAMLYSDPTRAGRSTKMVRGESIGGEV